MTHQVKWVDIIKKMNSEGIDCFVEVVPGKVLKKIIKQIIPQEKVYNISDSKSLEKVIRNLS